jgi:phosphate transport system substrate-binding protein
MSTASSGSRWRAALVAGLGILVSLPATAAVESTASPIAAAAGPTILGSGSSYAAVALDQWTAQAASLYGDNINYQTSSSVIGLNDYAQGQLTFAASEIGYSTGQSAYNPQAPYAPYQYLPDVAGATCLMYNLSGSTGQPITDLKLDAPTLLAIFTGQIQNWNDPAIAALNSGVALPNVPITKAYRSDASGENFIFSDYFSTLYPSQWNAFTAAMGTPSGAQAIFPTPSNGQGGQHGPYDITGFEGENGSDVASEYVNDNPGSITYVETAYALRLHRPCVAVLNPGGQFVQPSETADAVALTQDQLEPDLEQILTGVFLNANPQSYPISAYSYLITQVSPNPPAAIGAELGQFIQFIACRGQIAAGTLGYSPIPPNLVSDDFAAVNRLSGATQLSTPTAANCPNPYLTGGISVPGVPGVAPAVSPGSGAALAGAGSGGAAGAGSGGASTTTTNASATLASTRAAAAAAAANAAKVAAELKRHAAKYQVQIPGVALSAAAGHLLGQPGPSGQILDWTLLLVLAFVAVPVSIVLVRRRRRPDPDFLREATP